MADIYIEASSGIAVSVPEAVELPAALYCKTACGRIAVEKPHEPHDPEATETSGAPQDPSVPEPPHEPSKAELIDQAKALGIEVKSKMTKAEIAELIDERAAKAVEDSEAAREKVPTGVAPGTPTEAD